MAGPSIVVRVLGDLKGLGKSFDDAAAKGAQAAKGMHAAFSGVLGALNQTGVLGPFGDALNGVDTALDQIGKHGKQVGLAMIGVGGALAGVGAGLSAVGSKDQAAHQQLQAAVEATGKSYDDYAKSVEAAIKHQESFGHTANQTSDALRVLTQATGDPAKALQYLGTASDLAAAKHEDLTAAATSLGKAYNGNTRILKEFGIQVTKASTATKAADTATRAATKADQALTVAKRRLADLEQIDAAKKHLTVTEAVRLRDAQQKVRDATDAAAAAHQKLTTAQDAARKSADSQGQTMTLLAAKLHGQAAAAADTFGGRLAALKAHIEDAAASFGQKYGPAITAAGSATAVIGTVATVTRSAFTALRESTLGVRAALLAMAAAEAVVEIVGAPLFVTIGLIVAAVVALIAIGYVLYRNWTTIWKAMKAVVVDTWDWIKANWPLLVAIIAGPFGVAVLLIIRNWKTITDFFGGIVHWFSTTWHTVWLAIVSPFQDALGFIVRIWNDTIGRLKLPGAGAIGGVLSHVPVVGGQLKHLQSGGYITSTGLAVVHAGETVVPAGRAATGGPAVVIQHATFTSELDVEAFLRRAAWIVKTRVA
jgi:hypothetical protein